MNLFGRSTASRESAEQRRQKAQERAARMERIREARLATRMMEPPEPVRGLYVAAFLVAVGLVSFLSTDIGTGTKTVHGKTVATQVVVAPHNITALLEIVLALAAAASIYWRRRLVTGIVFMLAAAIGFGTPLPKGYTDGTWLAFGVPAAYVLWMLIFRMNKQQKAWLTENSPQSNRAPARAGRNTAKRSTGAASPASAGRGRRGKDAQPATAGGRPLPPPSRRYTPPKAKTANKK
jgi:hypothetical protein